MLAAAAVAVASMVPAASQAPATRVPRTTDGKPNLTGIWQVMNTANWDLQAHAAKAGPVVALGAAFAVQPGPGVVDGNEIPYRPEMLAKKRENAENWLTRTLVPDGNGSSMDGYRFANDFWLDFGHPAAASYVVDVVTRLVERYPVDGVRLDAVRYPEPPGGGASIGYTTASGTRWTPRASGRSSSYSPELCSAEASETSQPSGSGADRRVTGSNPTLVAEPFATSRPLA